jgi:hypothetical protein
VCVVLVLVGRESSPAAPEVLGLSGTTSNGFPISVRVADGKLQSFDTRVSVRCLRGGSRTWSWSPSDGAPVPFRQHGTRFYVRERSTFRESNPPSALDTVMRGELRDSGRVARGTIQSRAVWGTGAGALTCDGTATFSAREVDAAQ